MLIYKCNNWPVINITFNCTKVVRFELIKGTSIDDISKTKLSLPNFKPFVPNAPFLYPMKTSSNRKIFLCFQGGREGVHWEQVG